MLKMNSNVDLKKFAEEYGFSYCRKTSIYPRRYHKSFEGKKLELYANLHRYKRSSYRLVR